MKKYYEFIHYNPDDLEEENEIDSLNWIIIGWVDLRNNDDYTKHWQHNDWVYILQEEIDDNNIIFYDNYHFQMSDVYKCYKPLTNDELEEYIYSNKKRILVYHQHYASDQIFYKDLPEEIKNYLK